MLASTPASILNQMFALLGIPRDSYFRLDALMRLTARKSKRVKKPVYHYVISWRHDERPQDDLMRQVADTTCRDLGLDEYQRLYVAHRDTEHHHVHIVANRVHPETGVAWKNSHDYRRIEVSLRRQAEAMGMDYVPGRHNDPERFYGQSRRPRDRDEQRSRRTGEAAPARWDDAKRSSYRERLQEAFGQAQSWDELDRVLGREGLKLTRKGQGLVLGNDTGAMKLSDLGRDIRLKGLEERFGRSFAEHDTARARVPRPERDGRAAEFDTLGDVSATAEMSYYLYRAGIASREEVQRTMATRDRARAEVETKRLSDGPAHVTSLREGSTRAGRPARTRPAKPPTEA
jgi:hypothetical protein